MKLADYLRPEDTHARRVLRQIGVDSAVLRLPEADDGSTELDVERMERILVEFANDGMPVRIVEPVAPRFEKVKLGLPGRDQEIAQVLRLIETMGRHGIEVLCYNFMAAFGWLRTDFARPARGGALVSAYNHDVEQEKGPHPLGPITESELWDNLAYFLAAVLPAAEQWGVDLALHPDDPPVSPIRGVARILTSVEALQRALSLSDSPRHRLTFCQGTIATMGEDIPAAIRALAPRTAFVHFRDIDGVSTRFTETFHDQGMTDKPAAMAAWHEAGYDGYVRVDHVPTLDGESNDRPGYELLGRLHAVGYLQGLQAGLAGPRGAIR